jgi:putative transposase
LDEKIGLVADHADEHGLNRCLEALGVSKGTWHYRMRGGSKAAEREARDEALKAVLLEIIRDHPAYGYRRIRAELEERTGQIVNDKRLRRLLRKWDLSLHRTVSRPKPSPIRQLISEAGGHLNQVRGRAPDALEVLSTDFTELRYDGGDRKAWLIGFLDLESSWLAGWAVGLSPNRELALTAWQRTREAFSRLGEDVAGTVIHQDQDAVFTSYAWLRALLLDAGARVSYSENGAKGNPWIESFWARFKHENQSLLLDARTLDELQTVVEQQVQYYNRERRHSGLGYQPPLAYLHTEGFAA